MAAAAPYGHLPMELRPPYCTTIRGGITPSLNYIHWKFSPTAASARRPAYAITHKPTRCRKTWQRQIPKYNMTTFPWRFGHDFTPEESLPPLLCTTIISLCSAAGSPSLAHLRSAPATPDAALSLCGTCQPPLTTIYW